MLPEVLSADRAVADRWYVSNGSTAVGPVNLDLLARGIEAGKVPLESFVRHEAWKVWRPLSEIVETEDSAVRRIPPPPSTDATTMPGRDMDSDELTDDITLPGRPMRSDELTAADAFEGAADIDDALLLLLGAAVRRVGGEAALIYEVREKLAVVMFAHGTRMYDVLGQRIGLLDPAVLAARAGHAVVAEPSPGPAGHALMARLAQLGMTGDGAFMLPIRPHHRLFAVLEIGRRLPFRSSEIATIENLVKTLEKKAELAGWFTSQPAFSA
jgi:hypothetical protein